ncbi:MAG TPA: patatin-like phospholipase family protein [Alphaproteobacteria bacterium]|nr:patatin-like phospholipase family protein [Alphaproteobacteria bacterium]
MRPATPNRRAFLTSAAALAALPIAGEAASPPDPDHPGRLSQALVLSGGGARGVYQAGMIDYLRLSKQIPDGTALRPYQLVAGTSIGALNGYFVATAQYGLLRTLWYSIADQHVIQLKARYAKIVNDDSGVGTRFVAAMRLVLGLTSNDTGVIDGDHLRAWLVKYIDPTRPVVMPIIWTVTNLTDQSPEFFYLVPSALSADERNRAITAIRITVGPTAVLREATPDILIDALRASTAIPVAFDPVPLPAATGTGTNLYVDGGVTANTPVGPARAAATRIDVVLLDPPLQKTDYRNALEVGFGVFGAMQRRILEADLRAAYLETFGKRAIESANSPQARIFASTLYDSDIYQMQPQDELPVGVVGFDDRDNIYKTFKIGFEDARRGFVPYRYGQD